MKLSAITILLGFSFPVCLLYGDLRCPVASERRLRANWFCKKYGLRENDYACLFDEIMNAYQEGCNFQADILDPGEKYVINHRPKSVQCENADRYQPFGLQHFSGECVYHRSKCFEPGQVRFHDGSTTVDKSCRCNFDQGYAFVSTTVRRCFCSPSTEDCSCYLKKCPYNFKLSSDYRCIHMNNKSYVPPCPGMNTQEQKTEWTNMDTTISIGNDQTHFFEEPKNHRRTPKVVITFCIIIMGATVYFLVQCYLLMSPRPPIELDTLAENGVLTLIWSPPVDDRFVVEYYKIFYTSNEWISMLTINTDSAKTLSRIIPDILPLMTYRFKIASCLNNFEGKPGREHRFNSGKPNAPAELYFSKYNGNLIVKWTPATEVVFKTEFYEVDVTNDELKTEWSCTVPANVLTYSFDDFTIDTNYRFDIYTISHEVKSEPKHEICNTSPNYFVSIPYTGSDYDHEGSADYLYVHKVKGPGHHGHAINTHVQTNGVHDSNSLNSIYLKERIHKTFSNCPGNQIVTELKFRLGSQFLDFILISQNFYDETTLRRVLEKQIKTGKLGKLSVSMEGFIFQALDSPVPPQIYHVECVETAIFIYWTKPLESAFKTYRFLLQSTTDDWKTTNMIYTPANTYHYCFNNVLPSTQYKFRILTLAQKDISSLPSKEVYTFSKVPKQQHPHHSQSTMNMMFGMSEEHSKFDHDSILRDTFGHLPDGFQRNIPRSTQSQRHEIETETIDSNMLDIISKIESAEYYNDDDAIKLLDADYLPQVPKQQHPHHSQSTMNMMFGMSEEHSKFDHDSILRDTFGHLPDGFQRNIPRSTQSQRHEIETETIDSNMLDIISKIESAEYYNDDDAIKLLDADYLPQVPTEPYLHHVEAKRNKKFGKSEEHSKLVHNLRKRDRVGKVLVPKQQHPHHSQSTMNMAFGMSEEHSKFDHDSILRDTFEHLPGSSQSQRHEIETETIDSNMLDIISKIESAEYYNDKLLDADYLPQVPTEPYLHHVEAKRNKKFGKSEEHSKLVHNLRKRDRVGKVLEHFDTNEWKALDQMFIQNEATRQVLRCINEYDCVTITATPGFGKTATLRHVTLQMEKKGFDVILVKNLADIVKFNNQYRKTLFVIDDLFGKYILNQPDIEIWESCTERVKTILSMNLAKILGACQLQVYNDERYKSLLFLNTCVCNISSNSICIDNDEKTKKHSLLQVYPKRLLTQFK